MAEFTGQSGQEVRSGRRKGKATGKGDGGPRAAPRFLGVWIDHRVARIVEVDARPPAGDAEGGELEGGLARRALVETIAADAGDQGEFRGGWQTSAPTRERIHERAFGARLERFYKSVAARLQGAARVWVVGPGQAKTEFLKVLESCSAGAASMADSAAAMAKLTDRQLVAKVLEHFHPQQMAFAPVEARRRNRRLNAGLSHHNGGNGRRGR